VKPCHGRGGGRRRFSPRFDGQQDATIENAIEIICISPTFCPNLMIGKPIYHFVYVKDIYFKP
jgi:hypothetical protein